MIIILDNIRSLYNVGSIFRTADGVGIEKIYLCGVTPEPLDSFGRPRPQFVKVSLGAEKTVPWEKVKSAVRLIDKLKKDDYEIIAVEQSKKSIPYNKLSPYGGSVLRGKAKSSQALPAGRQVKAVFVFGNEVDGISKAILKKCDKIAEIPMRGKKESLNVSVAFGIVMFQLMYN